MHGELLVLALVSVLGSMTLAIGDSGTLEGGMLQYVETLLDSEQLDEDDNSSSRSSHCCVYNGVALRTLFYLPVSALSSLLLSR